MSAFRGQPTALGRVLADVIEARGFKPKVDAARAVEGWAVVAGPRICAVTDHARLRGDVLHVRLTSAAWRHTLHLQRDGWRDRLNAHLGDAVVREIVFR